MASLLIDGWQWQMLIEENIGLEWLFKRQWLTKE
jgi:hypothetical protein